MATFPNIYSPATLPFPLLRSISHAPGNNEGGIVGRHGEEGGVRSEEGGGKREEED